MLRGGPRVAVESYDAFDVATRRRVNAYPWLRIPYGQSADSSNSTVLSGCLERRQQPAPALSE